MACFLQFFLHQLPASEITIFLLFRWLFELHTEYAWVRHNSLGFHCICTYKRNNQQGASGNMTTLRI